MSAQIINKIEKETQKTEWGKTQCHPIHPSPFFDLTLNLFLVEAPIMKKIWKKIARGLSPKLSLLVTIFVIPVNICKSFKVSRSNWNAERANNNHTLSHLIFEQKMVEVVWGCDFVKWKWGKEVDEREEKFGSERNLPEEPLRGWRKEPLQPQSLGVEIFRARLWWET